MTDWYRSEQAEVTSVDRDGTADVQADVLSYLRSVGPQRWDVVDLDPFGSSMPALRVLLESGHRMSLLCMTEGALAHIRRRRRMNLYRHYGLLPDAAVQPRRWHYELFPTVVICGIARLAELGGIHLRDVSYRYNRYRMALYLGVECGS